MLTFQTLHNSTFLTSGKEAVEGKRRLRRKDNAQFTGNPHIVVAAKPDYAPEPPRVQSTFPEPLPVYLSRNTKLPTTIIPSRDPYSANAGRFSLSLKGMRRELRRSGFRAQFLVKEIERSIVEWIQAGGTILAPDEDEHRDVAHASEMPIGNMDTIFEVSRSPLQLVWSIPDDPFARYLVHCCARYHEVVSFSKDIAGRRLTYLLRPNVLHPDHHAPRGIDTPPATDVDSSSEIGSDISDVEEFGSSRYQGSLLSAISEDPPSVQLDAKVVELQENAISSSPIELGQDDGFQPSGRLLARGKGIQAEQSTISCSSTLSDDTLFSSDIQPFARSPIVSCQRPSLYEFLFST